MSKFDDENLKQKSGGEMFSEINRLNTFKDKWPLSNTKCDEIHMAKAGFYFCPHQDYQDLVRCFVCLFELSHWTKEDDPFEEHRKANPECLFAQLKKEQNRLTIKELVLVNKQRTKTLIKKHLEQQISQYDAIIERLKKFL